MPVPGVSITSEEHVQVIKEGVLNDEVILTSRLAIKHQRPELRTVHIPFYFSWLAVQLQVYVPAPAPLEELFYEDVAGAPGAIQCSARKQGFELCCDDIWCWSLEVLDYGWPP